MSTHNDNFIGKFGTTQFCNHISAPAIRNIMGIHFQLYNNLSTSILDALKHGCIFQCNCSMGNFPHSIFITHIPGMRCVHGIRTNRSYQTGQCTCIRSGDRSTSTILNSFSVGCKGYIEKNNLPFCFVSIGFKVIKTAHHKYISPDSFFRRSYTSA